MNGLSMYLADGPVQSPVAMKHCVSLLSLMVGLSYYNGPDEVVAITLMVLSVP